MTPYDRRQVLKTLALAPVMGVLPSLLKAEATGAGLIAANVCMLSKEVTEGPFYVDPKLIRADITEGVAGAPLALRLQVVAADCSPIVGARVDVWHCDAAGAYSGVQNMGGPNTTGQTFLRGTQMTDAAGIAAFQTIYPGWYPGRTVHMHYKVILEGNAVLTSQIFFDEAVSDRVYAAGGAYGGRGGRDRLNADDRIALTAGEGAICETSTAGGVMTASLVVGVNPDAQSGGLLKAIFG